jgi:hypothetical protein
VQFRENLEDVREFERDSKIEVKMEKKEESNMQLQVYEESNTLVERRQKLEQRLIQM